MEILWGVHRTLTYFSLAAQEQELKDGKPVHFLFIPYAVNFKALGAKLLNEMCYKDPKVLVKFT